MPEPSTTRTGKLLADVRKMPLFRQLAPMESGVGWPIPMRHRPAWHGDTAVFLKLPLYGYQRAEDGRGASLYPPFATLTVDWATGRPMEYADLRYTRPWDISGRPGAVGTFPHDAVRGSVREYIAAKEALLALYDEMLDALQEGVPFGAADEFGAALSRLMEPSLLPYYRILGGKFVERFLGPA
ncbi:hypothetical protein ACFFX1_07485 [Dactylosporangium sucinum]|uniref:Uncharacterized protein n=1 Tax=Dactylosporangium sucinum TaxID=1424081 RepID=A0A917X5B9_9ACTN|nr:hypothetical protein [Dactylosporangium sucinum]GGM69966.1 hypothetical protein GCM10007977_084650 [Dactylosporangium sucinum]